MGAGEGGESFGEGAGGGGDVALEHDGAGGLELVDEGFDDVGMVVAGVVDAVAGEEVEDDASVFGVELGAEAAAVLDVHAEEAEEAGPFGIDEVAVGGAGAGGGGLVGGGLENGRGHEVPQYVRRGKGAFCLRKCQRTQKMKVLGWVRLGGDGMGGGFGGGESLGLRAAVWRPGG